MLRLLSVSLVAIVIAAAPVAANEFCDKELAPLVVQRKELFDKLSAIGKRAKEPGAREQFCTTLTAAIGNIRKVVDYMEQNKDFCGVPDEAIDNAKHGLEQNQTLRKKICVAGAQQQQSKDGQPPIPKPPVELKLQ